MKEAARGFARRDSAGMPKTGTITSREEAPLDGATDDQHARSEHRERHAEHEDDAPVVAHRCARDLAFRRADRLLAVGARNGLARTAGTDQECQSDIREVVCELVDSSPRFSLNDSQSNADDLGF